MRKTNKQLANELLPVTGDKPLELAAIDDAGHLQAKFDRLASKMRKKGIIVD